MCGWVDGWVILFDMLTFDFLLKPPQPFTGLFFLQFFLYLLNKEKTAKHNKLCTVAVAGHL